MRLHWSVVATQTVLMKVAEVVAVTLKPVTHWHEMHRITFTVTRPQLSVLILSLVEWSVVPLKVVL